ncbi:kinesin-like protein KIN-4A [Tanacetum coccineum]
MTSSELVEVQEVYDLMERKEEFGGGGLKLEAKKDDGSNKCAPSVRLESVVLDLASHDSSGLQKQKSTYHLDKRSKKYVKLNNGDQVSASGKVDTAKKEEVLTSVDYYYDMQYSKPRVVPNIGPSLVPKELSYAGEVENIMKSDKSEGSTPTLLDLNGLCQEDTADGNTFINPFISPEEETRCKKADDEKSKKPNFKNKDEVEEKSKAKRLDLKSLSFVLQRKTEDSAIATKRLKELLEARKSNRDNTMTSNGNGANVQSNEKSLQRWLDHEVEVAVNVHKVRYEYEKQGQISATLA